MYRKKQKQNKIRVKRFLNENLEHLRRSTMCVCVFILNWKKYIIRVEITSPSSSCS